MAEQMRPSSKEQSPDPSDAYERSHPGHEAGQGRLDNNIATPTDRPDENQAAVPNESDPERQINAEDVTNQQTSEDPGRTMFDDEPTDTDLSPTNIRDPRAKRHPRIGGKGGTPNVGEDTRRG